MKSMFTLIFIWSIATAKPFYIELQDYAICSIIIPNDYRFASNSFEVSVWPIDGFKVIEVDSKFSFRCWDQNTKVLDDHNFNEVKVISHCHVSILNSKIQMYSKNTTNKTENFCKFNLP